LLAALTFFCGLALLLAVPGLQTAIFAGLDAVFGRPELSPEKLRQAHAVVLTPLATLFAAWIYGGLGRWLDRREGMPPAPTDFPPPPATVFLSSQEIALHLVLAVGGSWASPCSCSCSASPSPNKAWSSSSRPAATCAAPSSPSSPSLPSPSPRSPRSCSSAASSCAAPGAAAALVRPTSPPRSCSPPSTATCKAFVIYVWLGLVFARAYARTGRLSAAVAVHLGNNAITLALLLLAPPG
jgi:membrane protease YdiL (CAAX protease family)